MSPGDALRAAGARYLTSELASRRGFGVDDDGFFEDEPDGPRGALEVLIEMGAITAADAADWRARFRRAGAGPKRLDAWLRAQARAHVDTLALDDEARDAAVAAFTGVGLLVPDGTIEGAAPVPDVEDTFVATLAGPDARAAGLRVTVVELYEAHVVLHWHLRGERDDQDRFGLALTLGDDAGTGYELRGAGWGGTAGHAEFHPAPPPEASYLELGFADASLRIPLGH